MLANKDPKCHTVTNTHPLNRLIKKHGSKIHIKTHVLVFLCGTSPPGIWEKKLN